MSDSDYGGAFPEPADSLADELTVRNGYGNGHAAASPSLPVVQPPHRRVQPGDANYLNELGEKIFLDRYALKDMAKRDLAVGETVVVCVNTSTGQREIGTVAEIGADEVAVTLGDGEVVRRALEHVDRPLEVHPDEMQARVARGIAALERPEQRAAWEENFKWLLAGWKFVPGGRILTAAGTDQELTFYNCYVVPSPHDSREGIIRTLSQMTEIMSRGGGVGMNLSSLRPRYGYVRGVNGRSSGSVSWGSLYSFVTGLIEQGGCFGPDERIGTDRGLIPAAELADLLEAGEVLMAQTHEGPRRLTASFRNGEKELYEVTTARGYQVRVSGDHRMAVLREGQLATIPLRELVEGEELLLLMGEGVGGSYVPLAGSDYQPSIMSTRLNTDVRLPEYLHEELAYLVGYMYGDGYVHVGKKVTWEAPKAVKLATADAHPAIRSRLTSAIIKCFGIEPVLEDKADEGCANVTIYSRIVVEWLAQHGLLKGKAEDVRVPEAIFRSPTSVMGAFVAGYFDADGSDRGGKGGYGFDSVSLGMLRDVQQLLLANGTVSHISATDRSAQGWRTIYRLAVTGAEFRARFAADVPAEKVRREPVVRNHGNGYPMNAWRALEVPGRYYQGLMDVTKERMSFHALSRIEARVMEDPRLAPDLRDEWGERIHALRRVMPDRIASIEPVGTSAVYDFEVDDVHLLSGNGFYTSNSRRGALMLILNVWHPDVAEFITAKRTAGRITNANISVGITDDFMAAVEADADWDLVFPDTSHPAYDKEWEGDLAAWRKQGYPVVTHKTVRARELWGMITESAWASAEPGLWFLERSNYYSNSWYYEPLVSTNPCVTGDTMVYTADGLRRAVDLYREGRPVGAVVNERSMPAAASPVFRTGRKPVFRLLTAEGYSVRATADHRIKTPRGWVPLGELRPGESINLLRHKGGFGGTGTLALGRSLGWLVGDGSLKADRAVLSFFGAEKKALAPLFARHVNEVVSDAADGALATTRPIGVIDIAGRDEARVQSARLRRIAAAQGLAEDKHQVPETVFTGSEEMQRGFLQALFTADGGFQDGGTHGGSIRLASSTPALLDGAQMLLLNFGITSRQYRNRRLAGLRPLPDGRGGLKHYHCAAQHELVISRQNLLTFAREIGFLDEIKQAKLIDYTSRGRRGPYRESFTATVAEIVPDGEEDVYDLTEPLTHSFIANGIEVHNCGEQPLPGWSVCNLGAINLSLFAKDGTVDWADLGRTVRYAVRFLDNVIDATPYFFAENEAQQKAERRVGLGTMGLAELMIRCGVRYGSPEGNEFLDQLYRFIAEEAYLASADNAGEKGSFSRFDATKYLESGFMRGMPERVRQAVAAKGSRNVTLLTQAPTGTTGTMVATSTGIEPFFSWSYYRKSRLGLHEEKVAVVQEWTDAHPGEELPDYFVTAMDLSPEQHVGVQATIQRWVDSAISKTCNVPNSYTVEQTAALYELMFRLGCKGGTVYRDGSRDEQVLMLKEDLPAATGPAPSPDTLAVRARPRQMVGTTYRIQTPLGKAYITVNRNSDGEPFEVFVNLGKAGSDLAADAEAIGRLISLSLRMPSPLAPEERLAKVIEELSGIGGSRTVGFGTARVRSLPDGIANALQQDLAELPDEDDADQPSLLFPGADLCPVCGHASFVRVEGCQKCYSCGHSEC